MEIGFLDHVAIRVRDIKTSVGWYQKVLGLKKYQLPEWGEYPVLMLSKKSGIALFPATLDDSHPDLTNNNIKIDHFAFNVTYENFEKAKKHYSDLKLDFNFQDHHYFDSIYTKDPDGHIVELTTIKVNEQEFYK